MIIFRDGYDLSKVMFIATANSMSPIHPALRDRMEIINISGYTLEEKSAIAKDIYCPTAHGNGLKNKQLTLNKSILDKMVEDIRSQELEDLRNR